MSSGTPSARVRVAIGHSKPLKRPPADGTAGGAEQTHGAALGLSASDLDALIAYLRSL